MQVSQVDNFDLALLCQYNSDNYPFLLESVITNNQNRYSILFAYPTHTIRCSDASFLKQLEQDIKQKHNIKNPLNLPFIGGYFVYFSYEFAKILEPAVGLEHSNQLLASATYIPVAIIYDAHKDTTIIVDETGDKINQIKKDITKITDFEELDVHAEVIQEDAKIFEKLVQKAKEYIIAGDIFQANLSRQWRVRLDKDIADIEIYNLLRIYNPAPFAAFAKFDEFSIISSSPERLFCVDGDIIQTRPIAGTRPRNTQKQSDKELKNELKDNLKEQAEHLMLLDLERNDLGRVCEFGSVEADEIMTIESYQFVHHIVSNIKGSLNKNKTLKDIIYALFPGGTITGCPKIRCMQIIDELENTSRGAYTGSLGYISNCGKMDFNILIRTMTKHGKNIHFRAGGGIVFDSVVENELKETEHKAQGLLKIFN